MSISFEYYVGIQRVSADRKSTRLNSSHLVISYAVFCLKKKCAVSAAKSFHSHPSSSRERPSATCAAAGVCLLHPSSTTSSSPGQVATVFAASGNDRGTG